VLDFLKELVPRLNTRELLLAAVDVLVVAFLIYRVLVMIRGTRAAQMIAGMVLIGVGYLAARQFEFGTLSWLLDNVLSYVIIIIIVVFQDDIRRALMRMGRGVFMARRQREEVYVVEEVVRAVERMARLKTGALIVFERQAGLDEFIQPGTVLDARVSRELLWSVFRVDPENPVHDGAVIIRNLQIYQAGALLPLTTSTELERRLGTRHRAAIGITEETDAVVVVVSEERGVISLCYHGRILRMEDADALRTTLLGIFTKPRRTKKSAQATQAIDAAAADPSVPPGGATPGVAATSNAAPTSAGPPAGGRS
jgi:diadenylate cyclase